MRLIRAMFGCFLMVGLQAGCTAREVEANVEGAWRERCATAVGWNFCFLVPPSTYEERVDTSFEVVRGSEGRLVFSPWNSWTGRWDELVVVVGPADPLVATAAEDELMAWAGLWDDAQRQRAIGAGQDAAVLPKPYKTRLLADARGRRWAFGERRWRELRLPYTRVEQKYVTPVGDDGVKLEITFECSEPHPNCMLMDRMLANVRWERLK